VQFQHLLILWSALRTTLSGQLTFSGNNVCGGICSETVNFSFIFQWVDTTGIFGPGIYGSYIPGSFSATQSGSMGSAPITSLNDGHIYCCGPGTYIPLQAFNGELDLDVSLLEQRPDPGPPTVSGHFYLVAITSALTNLLRGSVRAKSTP
jgi:hypothetical protein